MSTAVQEGLITTLAIRYQAGSRQAFCKETRRVMTRLVPEHRPLPEARQCVARILRLALARLDHLSTRELLDRYHEAVLTLEGVDTRGELLDTAVSQLIAIFAETETGAAFRVQLDRVLRHMPDDELAGLTTDTLADQIGYSRGHLCVRIRQATGHTVRELILGEKIRRSILMLADETNRIRDIAARLGFSSAKQFRNAFRTATGVCPSEWVHRAT